jgi:light-regulated signal transduction histidine kinase (bacteriophytochrome)
MTKLNAKQERFKTVAGRRVQKVLDDLESLSNCANTSTYEYTDAEVRKMMKAITDKVALLKLSFEASNKSSKQTFEF